MAKIYKLKDPRTNRTRYIGMTTQRLIQRLCKHMAGVEGHLKKNPNSPIQLWLWELIELDLMPIIKLIKEVPDKKASTKERYFISKYRKKYKDLLNVSDGGMGVTLVGENHASSKLTNIQTINIYNRFHTKGSVETQRGLAIEFGVSRSCIAHITRGHRQIIGYENKKKTQK